MDTIRTKGMEFCLELNERKLEMMTINGEDVVFVADGLRIKSKESLVCLPVILSKTDK